jgi:hypothetical protein
MAILSEHLALSLRSPARAVGTREGDRRPHHRGEERLTRIARIGRYHSTLSTSPSDRGVVSFPISVRRLSSPSAPGSDSSSAKARGWPTRASSWPQRGGGVISAAAARGRAWERACESGMNALGVATGLAALAADRAVALDIAYRGSGVRLGGMVPAGWM